MKVVTVCVGSSCHLKDLTKWFKPLKVDSKGASGRKTDLKGIFLPGTVPGGIAVTFDGEYLPDVTITN